MGKQCYTKEFSHSLPNWQKTYEKNCQKCFSGRCMLRYLNAPYLFQCLTYHRQCKGQQKWFCKNYTSRIHSRRNLPNTLNRWNNSYSQRQKRESEIDPETTILCNPWIHSWFGDIFFSVLKGWLFQPSQNFSKCWLILGKNT